MCIQWFQFAALLFASVLCQSSQVMADLVIDYSHDAATDNFFGSNSAARNALEAAVSDINQAIDVSLAPVNSGITTGVSGGTTVSFNWDWSYTNPSTGALEMFNEDTNGSNAVLPSNNVVIYAGIRELSGSTLGQGGPGGVASTFSLNSLNNLQPAFDDAAANSQMHRGGGPVIHRTQGAILGATYAFDHGPSIGSIWFDSDSDNNGQLDSTFMLDQYWHFDHTTAVASGKNDFYTVALHELSHALRFGTADSWDDNVQGADWTGSQVIATHGTGANLINGGHFQTGLTSRRLTDQASQTPLMNPFLITGTRSYLTELDLAVLEDSGWTRQPAAVPEPNVALGTAILMIGFGWSRRKRGAIRSSAREQ